MMKKLLPILFGLVLISCKSIYMPSCEPGRKCTTTRTANKGIEVKTDKLGRTYISVVNRADSYLIRHKSERINDDPRLQDAGHVEEVFIELPSEKMNVTLKDEQLSELNIFFIRRCFCGPLAGTFPIEKGTLTINHSKDATEIDFHYTKPPTKDTGHLKFKIK